MLIKGGCEDPVERMEQREKINTSYEVGKYCEETQQAVRGM